MCTYLGHSLRNEGLFELLNISARHVVLFLCRQNRHQGWYDWHPLDQFDKLLVLTLNERMLFQVFCYVKLA